MNDLEIHQQTVHLLWEQRCKVMKMPQEKQNKYLIKLDEWILEVTELIEEDLKEAI